jgi:hypothetical protein
MAIFTTKKKKLENKIKEINTPPNLAQRERKYMQERKDIGEGKRDITGRGLGLHWKDALGNKKAPVEGLAERVSTAKKKYGTKKR